jgi:NAD(P)-dependent dehydrogenase (short-subunit alcohol dehydrogenase family)
MNILYGKRAIITGSTRGIGRAIAIRYAREGARVMINGSKSRKDAEAVVDEIQSFGGLAEYIIADSSTQEGVKEIFNYTMKKFNGVDIVVSNTGKHECIKFNDMRPEDWERIIRINLTSTFLTCSKAVEIMKKQGYGKIITISSKMGIVGSEGSIAYCSAKAAVVMLTKCLGVELAKHGIKVNCIAPGITATEPTFHFYKENPGIETRINKRVPMGRLASPDEIASAALFLASSDSDFITGTTILVDGGWVANSDYF